MSGKRINRHPWELSRTASLLKEWKPYIASLKRDSEFIDLGAGDMFFDRLVIGAMPDHTLLAIDLGYEGEKLKYLKKPSSKTKMYKTIEDVGDVQVDYAIMMDSIEVFPDALSILKTISSKVKTGGYLFFTMTAFQFLYSDHDRHVNATKRFNMKEFREIVSLVPEVEIVSMHYFYVSLFFVRLFQKIFRVKIDPDKKVTTGWRFRQNSIITRIATSILNIDYALCRGLMSLGIQLPGLSLMVICKKVAG